MTRIILLRHGQTEANRARRIQGQDDTALTRDGIAAIAGVAQKLGHMNIDPSRLVSYCSPLNRARETLRRLRDALDWDGPVTVDPRLMEIDFGGYTGRPVDEVLPHIQHRKEDPQRAYPGGESGANLKGRVLAFIDDIRRRHDGAQILVMTHFGPIETVLRHYLDIPVSERVWPDHGQIHRIDFHNGDRPSVTTL